LIFSFSAEFSSFENIFVCQMEQGLAELRKIFIKKVDEVIEKAKSTNEIEASLPSVSACITVYVYVYYF